MYVEIFCVHSFKDADILTVIKSCLTIQSIINSRLNVNVGKYRYKVCGYPYCNDTNSESEITSDIDVNSLVIINEYVFVQVENNLIFYHNYIPETRVVIQ